MDGIILINKEKGCTSHDVVNKVKHIFNEKVGHTGTLDPNATGLLPILVGKGTKLSAYLINHDKEYEVTLKLGIKTDTADSEGKVINEQNVDNSMMQSEKIVKVLDSFIGKQMQTPPIYSAIKINGKKLYEYARKNIEVEIEPRQIEIFSIQLDEINEDEKIICFTVKCSKGTYIRSLCEDIAERLGTIGYMKELNRVEVGIFDIKNSIKIEELDNNKDNEDFLKRNLISIEELFIKLYGENNTIFLSDGKLNLFLNGVKLKYSLKNGDYRIYNEKNEFIGIGSIQNSQLKREIIAWKIWNNVIRYKYIKDNN